MSSSPPKKPHILFLFSDTGGGHRSAAEAIIEALHLEYADRISTEMVDFFKDYAPPPLDRAPGWYPKMVRVPQAWELGFHLSDSPQRGRLLISTFWPYVREAAHRLVLQHPSDLTVAVHPLANDPVLRALGKDRPQFITVVTDLVSGPALWYHHGVDLCIVPTQAAYQRALECGMDPGRVQVIGLPVADRFCQPVGERRAIRNRLGWPQDRPIVLLVGGVEGMGPLKRTAVTIAESELPVTLVIVAGRNHRLKTRLEAIEWPIPTLIYGFVREMPEFMRAADILVTKAGPGTISEAFNAGLPMILYSRVPGQEDGNVSYVISEKAGIWAPNQRLIVSALRKWIGDAEERRQAAAACQRLSRPQAARQIAHILAERVGMAEIQPKGSP